MKSSRIKEKYKIPINYSVTRAILDILLDWGEGMGGPFMSHKGLVRWSMDLPGPPLWRTKRAIQYLEKLEKIKVAKKGDILFLKLTKKGKVQALLARLYKDYKKQEIWDHKWRVIIWDIPESSKTQRNQIRRFLRDLDFYQLQKSVFIAPYPLPDSAVEYLKESDLLKFIRFLRVDKVDNDRWLCRHFKLD